MENEWQPILYKPSPNCCVPGSHVWNEVIVKGKKIVRVRPANDRSPNYHCGAERFFEVHPEDAKKFWGLNHAQLFLCEHKILSAD